ncbi:FAD-binding oxidoreductase [Herbidospora cretacea]|uniref:FAD-binding oxidoreductase n=1 Tax=Herbidospora cretacea TaxID=28444 RepID=UPI0009EEC2DF|nr:FAD-binding oxidoreductase [Herbidospora cretacea]
METPRTPVQPVLWSGWGDPGKATGLDPAVRELLAESLGVVPPAGEPAGFGDVRLPATELSPFVLDSLRSIVGAEQVRTDADARIRHTRGKSTPDLLKMRMGDGSDAPDAVVLPASHHEIAGLLSVCTAERVAVVPFGGGTSVVGGVVADRAGFAGVVALDLRRLDRLVSVDEESMLAELQPGLRGPQAEELLNGHGLTLGHFPQSWEYATLGGFAAARSSGQASAGYGRFDDMVEGLTVATPAGDLELGRAPRSAAGPDLRQLILGSEGAFGVITSMRLRVRRLPAERRWDAWRFPSFQAGRDAMRALAQERRLPSVIRLSDETETMINGGTGCLMVIGYEQGDPPRFPGAEHLGAAPAERWADGRFAAPYLRDALLGAGATVETLETAAHWSGLPRLYEAVRLALEAALGRAIVMCHVSHVYETGASLYFTVATASGDDPLARWDAAKTKVSEAIGLAGGTISHHHGVGRDHRAAYAAEIGPVGVGIMRAIKKSLDPAGILNPGVLIP